ncbi:hydroxyacylglutathione hydrolase, partial [Acinetobacter baumannii]|nr:hydroxyacylglutathione hydrolase [Acinetobacter baumannii]
GTPRQMMDSLAQLAALPGETLVYCAHEYTLSNLRFAQAVEPDNAALEARVRADGAKREAGEATIPSTIALENATNPF